MGFMLDKYKKAKEEANLKAFLNKDEINDKGRELRKLEAKKEKSEEDEKKIRQIQKQTEELANQRQQAERLANRMSLGEKILKGYFIYKMTALLCRTLVESGRGYGYGSSNALPNFDLDADEKLANGELDVSHARADLIEQVRDQFNQINEEAKDLGISQGDIFSPEDSAKLTELADISRDIGNPQQAELYAGKCEELGLDKEGAMQALQQEIDMEAPQRIQERAEEREQNKNCELEM